jgi:hypothetical protein
MTTTPLQRLNEFTQRTGSRAVFGAPMDLLNRSHAPLWSMDLTVHVAHREQGTRTVMFEPDTVWRVTGRARTKKEAKQAAASALFEMHAGDVLRRSAPHHDARPTKPYVTTVRALPWRQGGHRLYVGAQHADRLATMGSTSGVVAVDTEGVVDRYHTWHDDGRLRKPGRWPAVRWFQACDDKAIVIVPFVSCETTITAFLRRTDITTVFCDYASDACALPAVAAPVADVQVEFLRVYNGDYPADEPVSLERMVERLDNGHTQRVVQECEEDNAFYDGFATDDVKALSPKHIEYMAADPLATYLVFVRLVGEGLGSTTATSIP